VLRVVRWGLGAGPEGVGKVGAWGGPRGGRQGGTFYSAAACTLQPALKSTNPKIPKIPKKH
jgi:hypothetical protein